MWRKPPAGAPMASTSPAISCWGWKAGAAPRWWTLPWRPGDGSPGPAPAAEAHGRRAGGAAPGLLSAVGKRSVLLRLQNNIKLRRLRDGSLDGALACTEDMLRLAPEEAALWREAAVMNQRLDRIGQALTCLERFLSWCRMARPPPAPAPWRRSCGSG
ncbi:tetratricopeptide repeat protein [Pseudoroseomonas wenyumeiae]